MRTNELQNLQVSEEVRRLNPELFGGVAAKSPDAKPQHDSKRSAQKANGDQEGSAGRVARRDMRPIVTITSFRARLIEDDDNLRGGCKYLRDAIAKTLGLDDKDTVIDWRYYQAKVDHRNEEGTLVKIETKQ